MSNPAPIQASHELVKAVYRNYAAYHQHPVNIAIHAVCVPLIILSIIGLLNLIPSPIPIGYIVPVVFIAYYVLMCPRLLPVSAALLAVLIGIDQFFQHFASSIYWLINVLLFFVCWALQFWGHKLEGNRPAFIENRNLIFHGPFMAAILALGHLFPRLIPLEMKT
jgi:uncharacterized membrane protein YGL010W